MTTIPHGSGAQRVIHPNELKVLFEDDIQIIENGYLYAYVSNGSSKGINFDNFLVTYAESATRQINHYYPYDRARAWQGRKGVRTDGLTIAGIHGDYDDYLNKYTSKELQTGEFDPTLSTGLEMLDFGSRFYDPQVGRWFTPDPAEQYMNPYLAIGNNPVMYVDPDGEWVFIVAGALLGAYIGGTTANGGEFNPGKWDYRSGDTWAGMLIGGGLGALGGWGAELAGPALANTTFFASFKNGTIAAYAITGGVAGGAIGYTSGFTGGMVHSNGNLGYSHQAGMFGMKVGITIGSFIGTVAGMIQGFDFSMPEYEAPRVKSNKPLTASSGNSGYGMSEIEFHNDFLNQEDMHLALEGSFLYPSANSVPYQTYNFVGGQHVRVEVKNNNYFQGGTFKLSDVSTWYYSKNIFGINRQVFPGRNYTVALLPGQSRHYDFYHFKDNPIAWSFQIDKISNVLNLRIRIYSSWLP